MGAVLGLPNPNAMAEQQAKAQRAMIERQLQMQLEMRERMMASQIAGSRDLVHWLVGVLVIGAPILAIAASRTGNRALLAPLFPLSIISAYNYDLAYGTKTIRIIAEAEYIMANERSIFTMPGEALTVDLLDRQIAAAKVKSKLN